MAGFFSGVPEIEEKNIVNNEKENNEKENNEKKNNCSYFQRLLNLGYCPKPEQFTQEQHEECSWWRKKLGMCKKNKQKYVVDCDCKKCLKECKGIDMSTTNPLINITDSSTTDSSTSSTTDSSTMDSSTSSTADSSTMDSSTADSSTTDSSTADSSTTDSSTSSTMDSSTTDSSTTDSSTSSTTDTNMPFVDAFDSIKSASASFQTGILNQVKNSTEEGEKLKEQALKKAEQLKNNAKERANNGATYMINSLGETAKKLEKFQNNINSQAGGRKGNRKTRERKG